MKKQTLFDLASMPKMILSITLIVMLGLLFGATSYLLKAPTTDLPIVNPVVESQCEIDSDCMLSYIGTPGPCLPCDRSREDYKCLNKDEVKKIKPYEFNEFNPVLCAPCADEFDKYVCECKNGKCEKVKIEAVEEVVITTDKMEYEMGEDVKITIQNNSDKKQRIDYPLYFIEKYENNIWTSIKKMPRPCGMLYDEIEFKTIKLKGVLEYEWDQKESECIGQYRFSSEMISNQVSTGKYRAGSKIFNDDMTYFNAIIYSNEFTVKEKSGVDTSDWQTYRNEEFGFEMKYSQNWKNNIKINDEKVKVFDGWFGPNTESYNFRLKINMLDEVTPILPEGDFVTEEKEVNLLNNKVKEKVFALNSNKQYSFLVRFCSNRKLLMEPEPNYEIDEVNFECATGYDLYDLNLFCENQTKDNCDKMFNQILSTFKFTEKFTEN